MAKAMSDLAMGTSIWATMNKVSLLAKASTLGPMVTLMMVTFRMELSKDMVSGKATLVKTI